jgi:hypothetical protein
MELDQHQGQPRAQMVQPDWKKTNWKQNVHPNVRESSLGSSAAKLPPLLEEPVKTATPAQEDSLPDARQLETVKPLEVLQTPPESLPNPSALSNILAPVSLNSSASKETHESRATTPLAHTLKITQQGKAERQDVSAADNAKITEAIKAALGGAKFPGDADDRTLIKDLERSSLPLAKSPSGESWPHSVSSPPTSNGSNKSADSPSVQEEDDDYLGKKATEVLKTLLNLGYTIQKDPNHSPKALNIGSAASNKSENLVVCQKCFKFRGRPCELK